MNYAVIMAGGSGTRFWPASRSHTPKQFLSIVDKQTMIQSTVKRLETMFKRENILVVGGKIHEKILYEQLPDFKPNQFILEPYGRNTAAAIGLAAKILYSRDPEANMLVLPSDHIIRNQKRFGEVVRQGLTLSDEFRVLLTIGLKPTRPETGYGYIQVDEDKLIEGYPDTFEVKTFAEKPNMETAERFLQSGDFLWNSGMFLWRADVILDEIKSGIPDLSLELTNLKPYIDQPSFYENLESAYTRIPNISIDYGVMEKSKIVYVLKADLGWSDVGSWDEVVKLTEADYSENAFSGDVIPINVKNTYVKSDKKLVALVGVSDLIIVETDDALLICKKGDSQNVKLIVDELRKNNKQTFL